MKIESALIVRKVNVSFFIELDVTIRAKHDGQAQGESNGGMIWLGFERLTCVPIQTRMVKERMLTREEKAWLKVFFPN